MNKLSKFRIKLNSRNKCLLNGLNIEFNIKSFQILENSDINNMNSIRKISTYNKNYMLRNVNKSGNNILKGKMLMLQLLFLLLFRVHMPNK